MDLSSSQIKSQRTESSESKKILTLARLTSSPLNAHHRMQSFPYRRLTTVPRKSHIKLSWYQTNYAQASASTPITSVQLGITPDISNADPQLWQDFSLQVQQYDGLRFIGHTVSVLINNAYYDVFINTLVSESEIDKITNDFEFLKDLQCYLAGSDTIRSPSITPQWYLQRGIRRGRHGQLMHINTHHGKFGSGNRWHLRGDFFSEAELTSSKSPIRNLGELWDRQQGAEQGANISYPLTYTTAVTGWPHIVPVNDANHIKSTRVAGFTMVAFVTAHFEAKSFAGKA